MLDKNALNRFVTCLYLQEDLSFDDVQRLIDLCPKLPKVPFSKISHFISILKNFPNSSFDLEFGNHIISKRSLDSVVALCDLVITSKSFVDRIMPVLLCFYVSLFYTAQKSISGSYMKSFFRIFTEKLEQIYLIVPSTQVSISCVFSCVFKLVGCLIRDKSKLGIKSVRNFVWPFLLEGFLDAFFEFGIIFKSDIARDIKHSVEGILQCGTLDLEKVFKHHESKVFILTLNGYLNKVIALLLKNNGDIFDTSELPRIYEVALKGLHFASKKSSKQASLLETNPLHYGRIIEHSTLSSLKCCNLLNLDPEESLRYLSLSVVNLFENIDTLQMLTSQSYSSGAFDVPVHLEAHLDKITFNTSHQVATCKTILNGFIYAAQIFPNEIQFISNSLFSILFSDSCVLTATNEAILDLVSDILSRIFQVELSNVNIDFVDTSTRRYILKLEGIFESGQSNLQHEKLALTLLGNITTVTHNLLVTNQVMPIFFQKFNNYQNNPKLLHSIVSKLADIALLSNNDNFEIILSLFADTYRKPLSQTHWYSFKEIRNAFATLSISIKDPLKQLSLAKRIMELLTSLAMTIQQELSNGGDRQFSSIVGNLGFLLPTLSTLLETSSKHIDDVALFVTKEAPVVGKSLFPSEHVNIRHFRSLWFLLVLYKFTDRDSTLFDEWFEAARDIAAYTPTLIVDKEQSYVSLDHEAKLILKLGGKQSTVGEEHLRTTYKLCFSNLAIKEELYFGKMIYMVMVYYLETFRADKGNFHAVFQYMEDHSLVDSGLRAHISVLGERVFQRYVEALESPLFSDNDSRKKQNILNHTIVLLVKLCHRSAFVRESASKYLRLLIQKYPFIQWNRLCLGSLLDIMKYVFQNIEVIAFLGTHEDVNTPELLLKLPVDGGTCNMSINLDLSESKETRNSIYKLLSETVVQWMEASSLLVSNEFISVLQEYIQNTNRIAKSDNMFYRSSSLAPNSMAFLKTVLSSSSIAKYGILLSTSLSVRQRFLGQIDNLYAQHNLDNDKVGVSFGICLSQKLQKDILKLLSKYKQVDIDSAHMMFHDIMMQMAGLIVWSQNAARHVPKFDREIEHEELMHLICVCPARVFTAESMQVSLFAWRWLISSSYSLSVDLFVNMRSAWEFTINSRKGLFSKVEGDSLYRGDTPNSLFTSKQHEDSDELCKVIEPHRLWIDFLIEVHEIIKHDNRVCLRVLTMMINAALVNPHFIHVGPLTFSPRFKMVYIGIKLAIQKGMEGTEMLELLRERVYHTAFAWFYESPQWIIADNKSQIKENALLIILICKALKGDMSDRTTRIREEEKEGKSIRSGFSGRSKGQYTVNSSSSFVTYSKTWVQVWNAIDDDDTSELKDIKFTYEPSIRSVANSTGSSTNYLTFNSERDLLIFFLSHELHRFMAWYNPSRNAALNFPDQELFIDLCYSTKYLVWPKIFELCWDIEPKLAFRLTQRFPNQGNLRDMLTNHVKHCPWVLYEIGDSVPFIITKDTMNHSLELVSHLAYYQPCSLPAALKYLKCPYSRNRTMTQYVMKSLESHTSETLIFYLNQILQALRYDIFGLLRKWFLKACSISPHLAHQLIWACQTESVSDIESIRGSGLDGILDPLPTICLDLEKRIVSNMNSYEFDFFTYEFGFFDNLTNISKELMDIPKSDKVGKDKALNLKLKSFVPSRNDLYVPSDHMCRIVSITPDSGVCLQSAAKVPFLVEFNVVEDVDLGNLDISLRQFSREVSMSISKRSSDLEEKGDTPRHGNNPHMMLEMFPSSAGTKEVIFKAGDDCRQDRISLQFIQVMRDIMKSVGLELYLVPYNVIPMRIGDDKDLGGVIEKVPYTQSRDSLGKANNRSLKQLFLVRYGNESASEYKKAQRNFVVSMAGYAVAMYILNVKDRHNGNILIDDVGHLLHIDFGFIFNISPGGDMNFEKAGFKFTQEMAEVMDGIGSKLFRWFEELCVRGFLAVRDNAEDFINMVDILMDSALGCFKSNSLDDLSARFALGKSEKDAAQVMVSVIQNSYNHLNTRVYDQIQWTKEGIWYGGTDE